jgi:Glyoxalase/Bleomycin resistance protein/Dioxygenase superfamily
MAPTIEKLSAVTFRVANMTESVRFYRDLLGMELLYGGEGVERARIAAAQRARWAKVREAAKVVPIRGKRTLSAAARRKIAAAQRARWAKVNAGQ